MNTTICGVDDRILYVVIVWAAISAGSRIYETWARTRRLTRATTRFMEQQIIEKAK